MVASGNGVGPRVVGGSVIGVVQVVVVGRGDVVGSDGDDI